LSVGEPTIDMPLFKAVLDGRREYVFNGAVVNEPTSQVQHIDSLDILAALATVVPDECDAFLLADSAKKQGTLLPNTLCAGDSAGFNEAVTCVCPPTDDVSFGEKIPARVIVCSVSLTLVKRGTPEFDAARKSGVVPASSRAEAFSLKNNHLFDNTFGLSGKTGLPGKTGGNRRQI